MQPKFEEGWECHGDFGRFVFAAGFLFGLNEDFRDREKAKDGGHKGDASSQICEAKVIAIDAAHRVLADGGDQEADQNGHPAFPNGARANR